MDAMAVEIGLELVELSLQIHGIPEEHAIEVFTAKGSDQPFNERVRRFISTIAAISSVGGPWGPGLRRRAEEEKSR